MQRFLRTYSILVLLIMLLMGRIDVYSQSPCDLDNQCVGNALTLRGTLSSLQFAQVERIVGGRVERSAVLDSVRGAFTFESHILVNRQVGKRQFIAGSWGINADQNDMWRVYVEDIGSATTADIVFEVDDPNQQLGAADNVVVRLRVSNLYAQWHHCSAIFDGRNRTVSMVVDGRLTTTASIGFSALLNADDRVPTQFGSISGINADAAINTPLQGQMDEIRLWNRAVPITALACQSEQSLEGNESGLIGYYRCNGSDVQRQLCDATGLNQPGPLIGATLETSNRILPVVLAVQPMAIAQTLQCDTATVVNITLRNTTDCPQQYFAYIVGDPAQFSLQTPQTIIIAPRESTTLSVRFTSALAGLFTASVVVQSSNRCGGVTSIPIEISRKNDLVFSDNILRFDPLLGGCASFREHERTLTMYNSSTQTITISSIQLAGSSVQVFYPDPIPMPLVLNPGEGRNLRIVFQPPIDSTRQFNDTLSIRSSDCRFTQRIPLEAVQYEIVRVGAFSVNNPRFTQPITFPNECVGQVGNPFSYIVVNYVTNATFLIDTIIVPRGFVGRRQTYPIRVAPALVDANQFVRFQPLTSGVTQGTVIIRGRLEGNTCTFEQRFEVRGRGVESRPDMILPFTDFGSVLVGRDSTMILTVRNNTPSDTLRISVSLRDGANFVRTGGQAFTLLPGSSATTSIAFRPVTTGTITDQICIFEQRCFASTCVSISGIGVNEVLSIEPSTLRIENTISCASQNGVLQLRNLTNQPQTLTNPNFVGIGGGAGRFTIVPAIAPNTPITLPPNGTQRWTITYTPNDNTNDRSDRARLSFTLAGQNWITDVLGTSLIPRVGATRLVTFGQWEVGDRALDTVYVENVSPYPVAVGAPQLISTGFRLLQALDGTLPKTLQSRERLRFVVEFAPQQARSFRDTIVFPVTGPCNAPPARVVLTGQGIIERTEIPISFLNFGFVYPCECVSRDIVLVNNSFVHEHTVESILTDGVGITPIQTAQPQLFTWKRKRTNTSDIPFTIAKQERDTIVVTYCPRTPSTQLFSINSANMRFRARGPGWSQSYSVYVAGRRSLPFAPNPDLIVFPPMIAGTTSATQTAQLTIPGFDLNPRLENVEIDSIGILSIDPPDAVNVFRIAPPRTGLTIPPNTTRAVNVTFHPLEAREYIARIALYLRKPCAEMDTTIVLQGTAYPSPNSLQARFDANTFGGTTSLTANPCDTIRVPIFLTRILPRAVAEFTARLTFDSTQMRVVGIRALQTQAGTASLRRTSTATLMVFGNTQANQSTTTPFAEVLFIAQAGFRGTTSLRTDSLRPFIDGLDPTSAFGRIRITNPRISAQSTLRYDSVLVGECAVDTLRILNTGDVAVQISTALAQLNLPRTMSVVSAQPPLNQLIQPNSSADVVIRYCPLRAETTTTTVQFAVQPCSVSTTTQVVASSYATPFTLNILAEQRQSTLATPTLLRGYLADTIKIALRPDRDMQAVVRGNLFIQRQARMTGVVEYSPYALKYISTTVANVSQATTQHSVVPILERHGRLRLEYSSLATIASQQDLAILTFVVPLPDTTYTPIRTFIIPESLTSDTLQYFALQQSTTTATFNTLGRCGIESIRFADMPSQTAGSLTIRAFPQPAHDMIIMAIDRADDSIHDMDLHFTLYDMMGKEQSLEARNTLLRMGAREFTLPLPRILPNGVYVLVVTSHTMVMRIPIVISR